MGRHGEVKMTPSHAFKGIKPGPVNFDKKVMEKVKFRLKLYN